MATISEDKDYFGNAIGDSGAGNTATHALVDAQDESAVRTHKTGFAPTAVTNVYDFNRDRRVTASDELTARYLATAPGTALSLITVPAAPAVFAVAARDWTDAGLTLTLGGDGQLHAYHTGSTIDAVAPREPAEFTAVSIVGRGPTDVLNDDYAGQFDSLLVRHATLEISRNGAIPADARVIVDGVVLEILGADTTVGTLTLLGGSVVTTATAVHATTVDVQAGQLTTAGIVADTLVIGAGSSVTIAPVVPPGGAAPLAAAAAMQVAAEPTAAFPAESSTGCVSP